MPVNPGDGERYAASVGDSVRAMEADMLALLRDLLRRDAPTTQAWAAERLAMLQWLRAQVAAIGSARLVDLERLIVRAIQLAYNNGSVLAFDELTQAGIDIDPTGLPAVQTAVTLSEETRRQARRAVAMLPDIFAAAYREAVAAGAAEVLTGHLSRLAAAQTVLDRLFSDGVRGFTDSRGRRWALDSYVEMAVRTTTGQAATTGHMDQLRNAGLDLVIVSDAPRECPLCRPWEGKILSIGGTVDMVQRQSVTTGQTVTIHVAGSLSEARAKGLQHPNCRHSVSAYLPGATTKPKVKADPAGYEAQQRQREIERHIRSWKRRGQYALTPDAEQKAAVKVREWQAAQREHVAANGLKRQAHREQVGAPGLPLAH